MNDTAVRFDRRSYLVAAIGISLFGIVLVRTAWLSDDAFIAFRTADNFVHGYGLRWNVSERVQTYTCPLWLLSFSLIYRFTREPYYTSFALSAACSLAALGMLMFRAKNWPAVVFVVAAAISSKAFTDYCTSGLENPLTHALCAGFYCVYFSPHAGPRRVWSLSLLASLVAVNRLDALLLLFPALLLETMTARGQAVRETPTAERAPTPGLERRGSLNRWANAPTLLNPVRRFGLNLLIVWAGMSPLIAWEIFSVVYYGFPFPNTAYAKLGAGIPALQLMLQGLQYYAASILSDPITLSVIAMGIAMAFFSRQGKAIAVAVGVVLYMLYIVRIGGDFMAGRFFSAPFFACLFLCIECGGAMPGRAWIILATFVLGAGLIPSGSPLRSGRDYGLDARHDWYYDEYHGVIDERAFYFPTLGLVRAPHREEVHAEVWLKAGRQAAARAQNGERILASSNVGLLGYYAGPQVTIVDILGLGDPFLSRLPALRQDNWRIGHNVRAVPAGYQRTLETGQNQIADRKLAAYYTALHGVTSGPLFSAGRWLDIFGLNFGKYDDFIDVRYYRDPVVVKRKGISVSLPPGSAPPAQPTLTHPGRGNVDSRSGG